MRLNIVLSRNVGFFLLTIKSRRHYCPNANLQSAHQLRAGTDSGINQSKGFAYLKELFTLKRNYLTVGQLLILILSCVISRKLYNIYLTLLFYTPFLANIFPDHPEILGLIDIYSHVISIYYNIVNLSP